MFQAASIPPQPTTPALTLPAQTGQPPPGEEDVEDEFGYTWGKNFSPIIVCVCRDELINNITVF